MWKIALYLSLIQGSGGSEVLIRFPFMCSTPLREERWGSFLHVLTVCGGEDQQWKQTPRWPDAFSCAEASVTDRLYSFCYRIRVNLENESWKCYRASWSQVDFIIIFNIYPLCSLLVFPNMRTWLLTLNLHWGFLHCVRSHFNELALGDNKEGVASVEIFSDGKSGEFLSLCRESSTKIVCLNRSKLERI